MLGYVVPQTGKAVHWYVYLDPRFSDEDLTWGEHATCVYGTSEDLDESIAIANDVIASYKDSPEQIVRRAVVVQYDDGHVSVIASRGDGESGRLHDKDEWIVNEFEN